MKSRTSQGLRDLLFDEMEELRSGSADPRRSLAVANLARQIVNTVRVELDFAKEMKAIRDAGGDAALGTLALGSEPRASNVAQNVTALSSDTRRRGRAK